MKSQSQYQVRSVQRALEILQVFLRRNPPLSLAQIAEDTGYPVSTVFRLLATLEALGFVEQISGPGEYSLGTACLELGAAYLQHSDVRTCALPFLRELRTYCQETVHLARLDGADVVYLEKMSSLLPTGVMSSQVGGRAPAYCTGVGKALLAYLPSTSVRELHPRSELRRYTANTIVTIEGLLRELTAIRQFGYAIDNQEHELDVMCIAAPVWDYRGVVVASISVAGPATRMAGRISSEEFVARVKAAARAISVRLGAGNLPELAVAAASDGH